MASRSTASPTCILESRNVSRKSMEENPTSTGKSGFVWPFNKAEITVQLPLKEKFRNSFALAAGASKLRMVGRGGSGSQLRQVFLSKSTVLEPDVHYPRQPPEPEPEPSSFYHPTGRGGLGSRSIRHPMPLKPPMALIRERKRGPASISQSIDPDYNEDTNSYIEETFPTCHEHRQHSLNKLTRTLGALPSPLIGLDNRSTSFESDTTYSPMTFSPPSPSPFKSKSHFEQIDYSFTTNSPTTPREEESEPSPSTTHIYVSNYSTSHFDTFTSLENDLFPYPSGPDAQCDWLVPLGTHSDELVVSITRTASSKPESWKGEWNDDIKDVIKSLRRL